MTLKDTLNDYLLYLQHEQGAALNTRQSYAAGLREFLRWTMAEGGFTTEPTIQDFHVALLRRYLYHLGGRGLRPRTIRGKFHAISSFGEYLVHQTALTENPAKALTMPKKDASKRIVTTDQEVAALIEACDRLAPMRRAGLAHRGNPLIGSGFLVGYLIPNSNNAVLLENFLIA